MIRKKNKELGGTFMVCEKGVVSAEQLAEIEKLVNNEIDRFNYSEEDYKEISIKMHRVGGGQVEVQTASYSETRL